MNAGGWAPRQERYSQAASGGGYEFTLNESGEPRLEWMRTRPTLAKWGTELETSTERAVREHREAKRARTRKARRS